MQSPMQVVDPRTGASVREYASHHPDDVLAWLDDAAAAQPAWAARTFEERAAILRGAALALRERASELAELMALEMGKPVREGRAEAEKCAWVCDYYADNAEGFLAPEPVESGAGSSWVAFRPLGVVLAVMPWNFPLWQVFRFAAPALMAGNGALLKHASNVPGCALAVEEILHGAGLPAPLFRTALVGASAVGALVDAPATAAVTLTGSTGAGRAVAARAGMALKKTVLELGGSDPYLILEDADLEHAARVCAFSRLLNGGQSCIAAKRFIVVEPVYEEFTRLLVAEMATYELGDPLSPETRLGPQARVELRDELHIQVQDSLAAGARLLLGGELPDRPGAWYPATVLGDVPPGCPASNDELFGPVAAIIRARDVDDAVRIANDSDFGLGAAVFTRDSALGADIAERRLQAGACFVNDFVRSDPRLPFGGIKTSGYGRELGLYGIREFVNTKTVWVR